MSVSTLQRDTAFQARSLFRSLLRQSSQFSAFNFREYARRRTKDAFRAHENEAEDRKIQELIQEGLRNLRMMKRQTVISQFYQMDKLVVEGQETGKQKGDQGGIVRQKDTGLYCSSGSHVHGPPSASTRRNPESDPEQPPPTPGDNIPGPGMRAVLRDIRT